MNPAGVVPLLAVAIIGVSASGPLMAAITAPALAIAFWRNAAATLILAPSALTRHEPRISPDVVWAGILLAGHFATWIAALKLTSVAAAIALVSLQVVWVAVIQALGGQRQPAAVAGGSVLALAGVLLITGVDVTVSRDALVGDLLALAGGMFAAGYVVLGARVRAVASTTAYTFVCYGVCALTLLAAAVVTRTDLVGFSARDWWLIAAVTVSAQLLGHSVVNHLLAFIAPVVMSLILLLEVPLAAVLAAIFLGESLPWGTYGGLVLIIAGLVWVIARRPGPPPPDGVDPALS